MTLRVGILTYDFYPFIGGQGRFAYGLWQRLREHDGIDVRVFSPARNALPGHSSKFAFSQRYGRHPLFSLLASASAKAWCRDQGIDVLHAHGGPGGALLLRDAGVPVVYSLYHTYEQVARLMPGHAWKAPARYAERAAYSRASTVTASTASTAASLRERLRIRVPVEVVPCAVDFDAFPRSAGERNAASILFVGRLDNRKNPGLLVEAFAGVAALRTDATLTMVGAGPLEGQLRGRVHELGIDGRVTFERFVDHDALVAWYHRAALVVAPALFEGFGLSVVEAQACGACVVATDTEGLRDVVVGGETGVLVRAEAGALSEAILTLLDEGERRTRLGARAARHVRQHYGWDAVVERFAGIFHEASASRQFVGSPLGHCGASPRGSSGR